ncbi:unnamed protein product [Urochloa humidicola]
MYTTAYRLIFWALIKDRPSSRLLPPIGLSWAYLFVHEEVHFVISLDDRLHQEGSSNDHLHQERAILRRCPKWLS